MPHTNWAGNLVYGASRVVLPATVAEAQEAVRAADKLRVVGSRHCFNNIADTTGTHLSLRKLNRVVELDKAKRQVTVEGGIQYGELGPWLHGEGFVSHNLASLPHISVAGATATASHGSGTANGNLATAIAAIEFIDAAGDLVTLSREKDGDTFAGAVVHLGALGVVTKLTVDVVPDFEARQHIYLDLPLAEVVENFDAVMSSGYSVSLFTDWRDDTVNQLWIKQRSEATDSFHPARPYYGGRPAGERMHPIAGLDAVHTTAQLGVVGPAYDRLPHFEIGSVPASGAELQVEYFVPIERAREAMTIMAKWGERLLPVLLISEVRTVAADDLWLSMCCRQASVVFHFSCHLDWAALKPVIAGIEKDLAPLGVRPHWGKLFAMSAADIQTRYPRMGDFRDLVTKHDPKGKFRNAFVDTYVFGK